MMIMPTQVCSLVMAILVAMMLVMASAQVTTFKTNYITTISGNGTQGYNGDGILATDAQLNYPYGAAVNSLGEVLIADSENNRIRKIQLNGTITTIAGTGNAGYYGDGILATDASLGGPRGLTVNSLGEVIIADLFTHRIRKIQLNGIITTIAGTGNDGYNGDGKLATDANLFNPYGVTVNSLGEVLIADNGNNRIRKILMNGTIITIAGNGKYGYNGDGMLATDADLHFPYGVSVNSLGEVLIADTYNHRIRKILLNGTITTIAGTGVEGYNGDGILATDADLNYPNGVVVNSLDEVIIADTGNNRIRKILLNGTIITIAGNGNAGYNGDGKLATDTNLGSPNGIVVNSLTNEVLFAESANHRIRRLSVCPPNSIQSGQQCNCAPGYFGYGQYCDKYNCSTIVNDRSDVCSSNGKCVSPNNCKCNSGWNGTDCEIPLCDGIQSGDARVCNGNGVCSTVDTCVCKNGFVGKQCSLYYISNHTLSVSFNSTEDYVLESSTTVRIVINNPQFIAFYKTRSVTARYTYTLDSGSPVVVSVVLPALSSSTLETYVPSFKVVGKVSVSVQLTDTESGIIISDNVQSTNSLSIVNRSRLGSASQSSYLIGLLVCLVISLISLF